MKHNIIILLLFMVHLTIYGQNNNVDSLANKSYPELKDIFYNNLDNNSLAEKIARYTLKKATREKAFEAIANSYIRLHYVFEDDGLIAEKYIDTSIVVCNTYNLKELLAENYSYKGDIHYELGKYNSALKYYLQSRDYYKDKNRKSYYSLHHSIGILKLRIRANKEALNIFKDCLLHEEEAIKKEDSLVPYSYLSILRSLAIAYAANHEIDSTSLYNKKGYNLAKLHPEYNELNFTHIEGGNQFLKGNYKTAEDSLIKALPYLKQSKSKSKSNLAIAYGHLGRIYIKFNKPEKAMFYYKKVDSIFNADNYIIPDPREIYWELINYYENKEDVKQQLYYTNQLLTIDSILTKDYRIINTTFNKYDVSNLTKEKERLKSLLNKEKSIFKKNTIFLSALIIFLVLLFIYLYRKKIKNEKRFNAIINELQLKNGKLDIIPDKKEASNKVETKAILDIDQKIIDQILMDLKLFEDDEEFLKPKISLSSLAKRLNTNTKYLSKVINRFKDKTFSNYINDLRIDYVTKQLQTNTQLKKYTITAMAKEVGFTNTETFTKAFFKKNGLTVSYFIKKLEK